MMVFTTMPFGKGLSTDKVWAADEAVTEISTPEGFADMEPDGNYKLVANIEVKQPYSKSFRGTFDGDGHVITLKAKVSSGNAGLFAETSSGADIKNVIVNAEIVTTDASFSNGTGGLIGKISGDTRINNCGVCGSIINNSTSTGYPSIVGGLVGYHCNGNCVISNSFTNCSIVNDNKYSSACTGGVMGKTSNYYTLEFINSYVSGDITGSKGYIGGITGYENCNNNYKHTYRNCYVAGKVQSTNTQVYAYGFASSYLNSGVVFENCFYNSDLNDKRFNKEASGITGKSSVELKGLASELGDAFQEDKTNLNNGYLILDWQYVDPNATCTVKFNISPKKSVLTWDGKEQAVSEFAWLAQQVNSGKNANCSAVLTKDIDLGGVDNWTPIGKSSGYPFKGNFDGQGYAVRNLKIESSKSENYGLFGYVNEGTAKNLIVDGKIDISGSGSSSYGVAGIVETFYGTKGTIENCINKVVVNGSQNVGGIVRYISGGYNTATKSILNCINEADIKSNSNNAAGIVGYVSGQVTIDSCYNRGNCTTGSWRAGGIVAYLSNSYAKINNCYSTGSVTGKEANPVVGKKSSGSVSNCYYLDAVGTDANATAKTADELKALAPTLGGNFIAAPNGMNDGYSILKFQIQTYQIKFTVNDENAVVSIEGQDGKHEGNTWTFTLPDGEYAYTVSSYGKVSQYGEITVKGAGQEKDITLEKAKTKDVSFDITPKGASVTVSIMLDGKVVKSGAARTYTLPYGEYTYLIKTKGYAKVSDTLKVDETSDASVKITLTESSAWDGETLSKPSGDGTEASPYIIDDGEMLAWLAKEINDASSVKAIYAELADDINLGDNPWTPIGKDFHEFQGSFDGKGYTVCGINVKDTTNAGLFGVIKGAEIKNFIVSGTISGTENAGGIAGKAKDTDCKFINCGNEATVNGKNSAGILGYKNTYELKCELSM